MEIYFFLSRNTRTQQCRRRLNQNCYGTNKLRFQFQKLRLSATKVSTDFENVRLLDKAKLCSVFVGWDKPFSNWDFDWLGVL